MKSRKVFLVLLIVFLVSLAQGNFQAQNIDDYVTLYIYKVGNGSGVVVSSPPGIDCGDEFNDCSASFPRSTAITLKPRALHGPSNFHGWSVVTGSTVTCAGSRGDCHFMLMENSSAQAEFILN